MNPNYPTDTECLILFLSVPDSPVRFPASNFVGAEILARLIDARLESVGQLAAPSVTDLPLNQTILVCRVRDAHKAAAAVWKTIGELCLADNATLYRWDKAEGIVRSLFPFQGRDILGAEVLLKFAVAGGLSRIPASWFKTIEKNSPNLPGDSAQ